jgi:hypothetical protein
VWRAREQCEKRTSLERRNRAESGKPLNNANLKIGYHEDKVKTLCPAKANLRAEKQCRERTNLSVEGEGTERRADKFRAEKQSGEQTNLRAERVVK